MAVYQGKDGVVKVGVAAVAEIETWEFSETNSPDERKPMGAGHPIRAPGMSDSQGSLTCWNDPDDTTGQGVLVVGAAISLLLLPGGDTSGKKSITVSAIITEVGLSVPAEGFEKKSFSFVSAAAPVHGAVV